MDHTRRHLMLSLCSIFTVGIMPEKAWSNSPESVLESALGYGCGKNERAIRNTLKRIKAMGGRPKSGRVVLVDIPSQRITLFENGNVVLYGKVVVGDADWQTPDIDATATFVEINPTWTVPESIVKIRNWREKLIDDPEYFEKLNFDVECNGRMISPTAASDENCRIGRFVQKSGDGNALGRIKIGLSISDAIYLHDTNDLSAFDEDERTLSHGCVRVQDIVDVAAWVLGKSRVEIEGIIESDKKFRMSPQERTRVMTTYFTAWPDESGKIIFYDDIYGKDNELTNCQKG